VARLERAERPTARERQAIAFIGGKIAEHPADHRELAGGWLSDPGRDRRWAEEIGGHCPETSRSSSAPIRPSASSSCPNAGSSSGPSPGSDDAEGSPRIGSASTARHSPSSSSLPSASCCESYAIQNNVPGQTLREKRARSKHVPTGEELAALGGLGRWPHWDYVTRVSLFSHSGAQ
jgi:hypothetical protein